MRGYSDVTVGECPPSPFFYFFAIFPHFIAYLVDFIKDLIDMGSIFAVSGSHIMF